MLLGSCGQRCCLGSKGIPHSGKQDARPLVVRFVPTVDQMQAQCRHCAHFERRDPPPPFLRLIMAFLRSPAQLGLGTVYKSHHVSSQSMRKSLELQENFGVAYRAQSHLPQYSLDERKGEQCASIFFATKATMTFSPSRLTCAEKTFRRSRHIQSKFSSKPLTR
jgi:hypothetical protein